MHIKSQTHLVCRELAETIAKLKTDISTFNTQQAEAEVGVETAGAGASAAIAKLDAAILAYGKARLELEQFERATDSITIRKTHQEFMIGVLKELQQISRGLDTNQKSTGEFLEMMMSTLKCAMS